MFECEIEVNEAQLKAESAAIDFIGLRGNRKTIVEAANEGLIVALRRHFSERERDPQLTSGFPQFGKAYPKRYFWRGTRGTSVSERIKTRDTSAEKLTTTVYIDSPALAHKVDKNPPEIRPTGGRKFLAIPANPVSAQWTGMPRDFPGGLRLAYSRTPDGHWLPSLIAAANYRKTTKSGRDKMAASTDKKAQGQNDVVYWLVHKVQTLHDPYAMPTKEAQAASVTSAVRTAIRFLLSKPR